MTKKLVHVTTLDQWKSVLDVWFNQGYTWNSGDQDYNESSVKEYYEGPVGEYKTFLNLDDHITYLISNCFSEPFIEYSEFIGQKKEDNNMETIYVTQDQLDLIEELKERIFPLGVL